MISINYSYTEKIDNVNYQFLKNTPSNLDEFLRFINTFWKSDHIFVRNKKLFDWQHLNPDKDFYNFAIARDHNLKIIGILGFIPTNHFDPFIKEDKLSLAIWKSIDNSKFVGLKLLSFLEKTSQANSLLAFGINSKIKVVYKFLGFHLGVLSKFYILNPYINEYKIIRNVIKKEYSLNKYNYNDKLSLLKVNDYDNVKYSNLFNENKTYQYLLNRYINHPFYRYFLCSVNKNGFCKAILVIRKIYVESLNSYCLRIIDLFGNLTMIGNLYKQFSDLLNYYNAEYIDFMNYGLTDKTLINLGFSKANDAITIPNYFEPLDYNNTELYFAKKSMKSIVIFKGDSDQDRPN